MVVLVVVAQDALDALSAVVVDAPHPAVVAVLQVALAVLVGVEIFALAAVQAARLGVDLDVQVDALAARVDVPHFVKGDVVVVLVDAQDVKEDVVGDAQQPAVIVQVGVAVDA